VNRGELYLMCKPGSQDPQKHALADSRFSTLICAPVYSRHDGLSTQVPVGTAEGLKKESSIHCDELVSLPKSALTHYVGSLKAAGVRELNNALTISLGLEDGPN